MFALLFDRRSLIVTGIAIAGVGGLLFAAGVVTGLNLRQERVLVPPYWLKYGPVETSDVRTANPSRATSPGATAPGAATGSVRPAPTAGNTGVGDSGVGDSATDPDWVPFAAPGDPTPSETAPRETSPPETAPATGGARAKPPEGVAPEAAPEQGAATDGAPQGGAKQDGAKQDGGSVTPPATPPAGANGGAGSGDNRVEGSVGGPPRATTRRAARDCPAPDQPTWYVQTGAYAVPGNARVRRDSLQARFAAGGPGPYLRQTTNGAGVELTLVRLGPFSTRQAARRAAAALDDAFVGVETAADAAGCSDGESTVAGRGQDLGTVTLAAQVSPAG